MSTTATTTVYCFLEDTAAHRRSNGKSTVQNLDQQVLYLTDQMINYFVEPSCIKDLRTSRNRVFGINTQETLTGTVGTPDGKMTLHFDGNKIGDLNFTNAGDNAVTVAEVRALFNIIEYIAYKQDADGTTPTASQINTYLATDTNSFAGYQPGTVKLSDNAVSTDTDYRTRVTITSSNASTYYNKTFIYGGEEIVLTSTNAATYYNKTGYIKSEVDIDYYLNGFSDPFNFVFRQWIEFEMTFGGSQYVCFKIWLSEPSFETNYPFTNITDILYPCDPNLLRQLETVDNVANLLSQSSYYRNSSISATIGNNDHSGVYNYACEYINTVVGNGQASYMLYFGAVYKGRVPTSDEARIAIKADLLARTTTQDDDWMDILPGLFASAAFMLIPLWHHYKNNASNTSVPSAAYLISNLYAVARTVFPTLENATNPTWISQYLEVLENAVSDTLVLAIPATDNGAGYRSIQTLHPTYMGVSNDDPNVNLQDTTTIAFAEALNNAIGQLSDGSVPVTVRDYNGRNCLSFTVDGITYYVVCKAGFPITTGQQM